MLDLRLKLSRKKKAGRTIEDLQAFEGGHWKTFGQIHSIEKDDKVISRHYESERGEEHIYRGREATLALAFESGKASWGIDASVLSFLEELKVTRLCFFRKIKSAKFAIYLDKFKEFMYRDENPPFQKQVFVTFDRFAIKTVAVSDRKIEAAMSL
jgi:phosphatidylserine/phosphatidylglycerophosphate/cardiolipin synthase-like enzyme